MDGGGTNEYLTNPQLACLWDGMFTRFWWTDDWLAGLGGSGGVHGHGGTLHSAFFCVGIPFFCPVFLVYWMQVKDITLARYCDY